MSVSCDCRWFECQEFSVFFSSSWLWKLQQETSWIILQLRLLWRLWQCHQHRETAWCLSDCKARDTDQHHSDEIWSWQVWQHIIYVSLWQLAWVHIDFTLCTVHSLMQLQCLKMMSCRWFSWEKTQWMHCSHSSDDISSSQVQLESRRHEEC